jgi:pilus assembly protein Flp/PilA
VTDAKKLYSSIPALSCRRNCKFILDMSLNYFIKTKETLKRLRANHDGVVSFEYIVVATLIIIIVIAVYSGAGGNSISGALSSGFAKVTAAMNTL